MGAGSYLVLNSLNEQVIKTFPGPLRTAAGVLSNVSMWVGGTCTSADGYKGMLRTIGCDSYSGSFPEVSQPGSSQSWEPPVPSTGLCHCPPPGDWALSFVITATGNQNAYAQGSIPLPQYVDVQIEFLYHVNNINGTAFYAYQISQMVNGAPTNPTLYSIGETPAAVASPAADDHA